MAKIFPTIDFIENSSIPKTAGELYLLKKLSELNDSFFVYYQPTYNLAKPDIVIVRENAGVLIIEVKDWKLSEYERIKSNGKTRIIHKKNQFRNEYPVNSPFEQVKEYKNTMIEMCPDLNKDIKEEKKNYSLIKTCVFFSNADSYEIERVFGKNIGLLEHGSNNPGIPSVDGYTVYWCKEDAESTVFKGKIDYLLHKWPFSFFSKNYYDEMIELLSLSDEMWMQFEPFTLDDKQKKLAKCDLSKRKHKLKGIAGSGKTLVIAQKALNCYMMKKTPVLILTFNKTLTHYIRDKISQNGRSINGYERRNAFHILHWDSFLDQAMTKNDIPKIDKKEFKILMNGKWTLNFEKLREKQMESIRNYPEIKKYDTILIDEVQDYKKEWLDFIEECFAHEQSELLFAGDEKQNIYDNAAINAADKLPLIPKMPGRWDTLTHSYRCEYPVIDIAQDFQKNFLSKKYIVDNNDSSQTNLENFAEYYNVTLINEIYGIVLKLNTEHNIAPNDICIIGTNIYTMREVDYCIRNGLQLRFKTYATFETKEEFEKICDKYHLPKNRAGEKTRNEHRIFCNEIEMIRGSKKTAFEMNKGAIKLSTIHSFKGWEINTLIIVIDKADKNDEFDLYSDFASEKKHCHCRLRNQRYHDFFENIGRRY